LGRSQRHLPKLVLDEEMDCYRPVWTPEGISPALAYSGTAKKKHSVYASFGKCGLLFGAIS